MSILEQILSSRARAEIFRLLFGLENRELHGREIERRSGFTIGTVRHELQKLEQLQLIIPRRDSNRVYYRANKIHPIYREIHNLVLKTNGLVDILKEALSGTDIDMAFVFGSVAQDKELAESDVDLMVIGHIGLRDLVHRLVSVSDRIGREVNPHIMTMEELKFRWQKGDHFITNVLQSPKLIIKGSEDDVARLGK